MAKKSEEKILKYKVITVTEYLDKARKLFGEENAWENAVALIYTENKVIEVFDRKGESKFLVEV